METRKLIRLMVMLSLTMGLFIFSIPVQTVFAEDIIIIDPEPDPELPPDIIPEGPSVLYVPADITVEATGIETPVNIGTATTPDANVTITNNAPPAYQLGVTSVTWTAVNSGGYTTIKVQLVTIVHTIPPALTVPANITIEAIALENVVSIGNATADDVLPVSITNNAPESFGIGETAVTWTAADSGGLAVSAVQLVTVVDQTQPVLTVPTDVTTEATAVQTPVNIGMATATDIFNITITNDAPQAFGLGMNTITWTATDANGNVTRETQRVTVADTTPPALATPADITAEATGLLSVVSIGNATANDIFSVTVTNDAPQAFGLGTNIITWTATDANGNITEKTQRVTVVDNTPPVLTIPADITTEATSLLSAVSIGNASATDIFSVTVTNDAPQSFGLGTNTITWTATDANGNVTRETQKVTVVDTTQPALTIPADITTEATAVLSAVSIGNASATDIFQVTVTNDAPQSFGLGTNTVTWTATDANGNETRKTQKITVLDTTAPALSAPSDITKEATSVRNAIDIGTATSSDIFPITVTNNAPADYGIGTTAIIWSASDTSENIATTTQRITIVDTTPPVLTVPADITTEATGVLSAVSIGNATANDIFSVTVTNDAPQAFGLGTNIITWTATDANGNVTQKTQKVTVLDTTAPALNVPADITSEAIGVLSAVSIGNASATDIFHVTVTNDAPQSFGLGTNTVTWTATDANGNVTRKTQKVTVVDTTPPALTVPTDITTEASGVLSVVSLGNASATDIFNVAVTNDAPQAFGLGTNTITWTATDENGNVTRETQKVTVVDTTLPELTAPGDITTEATGVLSAVSIGNASATDIFDVTVTNDAPQTFGLGTNIVTWTATDANGNETRETQKVMVVDNTPPVLTAPADIAAEATGVMTAVAIGNATATDIFDVAVTNDAPQAFGLGTNTVTWTATDANGNITRKTQRVTVVDTAPPALTIPADITAEATGVMTAVVIGNAAATDLFSVTVTNDAPQSFGLGMNTVTWIATDANGNVTQKTQKVTVVDTTAPALNVPVDVTTEATAALSAISIGNATATDIFNVEVTNDAPQAFGLGMNTVTWTATDVNGNVTLKTQKVTVVDTTQPALTIPADITTEATAVLSAVSIGNASTTDIFPVTVTNDAPQAFPLGATNVIWTAADANGNKSLKTQLITIIHTVPPTLTAPADITAEATGVLTQVAIGNATATDIFPVTVTNNAPVTGFGLGVTAVTWTAVGITGVSVTAVQHVTITHNAPVLSVPADITVEATAVESVVSIGNATAVDVFPVTITNDAPAAFKPGVTRVTWTATDTAGLSVSAVQLVTVVDHTPPALTVPADVTTEATAVQTPVNIGAATATDIFDTTITNDAPQAFGLGMNTITWTATDANGNETKKTQKVTVIDTTAPALTVPADITTEAIAVLSAVGIGNASANDIFSVTVTNDAPPAFPLGVTSVTWTATDVNGNVTKKTQKLTVVDTTPPALTVPEDITTEATGALSAVNIGNATVTDIFPVTITNDAPQAFPIGSTNVTWTAADANGNKSLKNQLITIVHTVPPALTAPTDITAEATGVLTAVAIGNATVTDVFPVTVTNNAPAGFGLGVTEVTWTAIDTAGVSITAIQHVTIVDTMRPSLAISMPVAGARLIIGLSTLTVSFAVTDVDPNPVVQAAMVNASGSRSINVANGQTVNLLDLSAGLWELNVSATDWAGNAGEAASGAFTVLSDTTPPVTIANVTGQEMTLAATDDISGVTQTLYRLNSEAWQPYLAGVTVPSSTSDIYYYSIDAVGNQEAAKNYHFNVTTDTVPPSAQFAVTDPSLQCVDRGITYVNGKASFGLKAWDPAVNGISSGVREMAYKADGGAFVAVNGANAVLAFSSLIDGLHTISYKAKDNAGNESSVSRYTAVFDKTKPVVKEIYPANGGRMKIKKYGGVRIEFSEPVKCADWSDNVVIHENGNKYWERARRDRDCDSHDFSVTYDPASCAILIKGKFEGNNRYTITLKNGITDRVGNRLNQISFTFKTLISAREGCKYEDEDTGFRITAAPDSLPCDGYFDIKLIENVCLPRIPKPYQWLFDGKKAYMILFRDDDDCIVNGTVKKPFNLVMAFGGRGGAFAPSVAQDNSVPMEVKNMKLYQVGSVNDGLRLVMSRASAQGAPGAANLVEGSMPSPMLVPQQAGNETAQELSADVSAFGMFTVAGLFAPGASLDDLSCYPNPFDPNRESLTIQYYLINQGDAAIAIYDLFGGLVKAWEISSGDSGAQQSINQLLWDGRNGQGNIVANGGYIVSVHADGKTKRFKVLVIK